LALPGTGLGERVYNHLIRAWHWLQQPCFNLHFTPAE
jgi:hypothetical protein